MGRHYLIYGHSGSYNHGAEALARTTMALLREQTPGCRITLSTHFAEQDREFSLPVDEFVERNPNGATNAEIYAPTIGRITPQTVCLHIGGDNYCYRNWQRWAMIHHAAVERGAKSVLWGCSIDPDVVDAEMLDALKTHHLITARESATYNALLQLCLTNVKQVSDTAFFLKPEPADFELENYVVINASPLVAKRNQTVMSAYQTLVDYIIDDTDMNIALVPHVVQPVDNDCDALKQLDTRNPDRMQLVSDKLSAGQYKLIIGKARFCVSARTHAAIAAYSSCVPTLAVSYSAKSRGIAADLGMARYVADVDRITDSSELKNQFVALMDKEKEIKSWLAGKIPQYIKRSVCRDLKEVQ
jgi:polysaccharide pyruvyl transferase WcaK-like protein